jgi:magnesium-transporting ATPase (P-type)
MYSMWTGVTVLDDICLLAFNTFFMVAPLFAAGLFDKDINPDEDRPSKGKIQHPPSLDDTKWYVQVVPKLYTPGQLNVLFSSKRLVGWLLLGLTHSVFIYFGVFGSWAFTGGQAIRVSGMTSSFSMDQQALYTILLLMLVSLHAVLVSEWNFLYGFCVIVLHVILYISFAAVYDRSFTTPYNYIADATMGNWFFWFMFCGIIAACVVPLIALRRYRMLTKPSYVDVITCKKKLESKSPSRIQTLTEVRVVGPIEPVIESKT